MSIVGHTLEQTTQPEGGTHNVVRMTDHLGKQYMVTFFAPAGYDLDARIAVLKANLEAQLAEAEAEAIIGGGA